jgi:hypothetical protein
MFKWLLNTSNKRPKNILYLSIDMRSIGIAFYSNDQCLFYDRKFYLNNQTIKPIEFLFKESLFEFKKNNNFILDEICVILEYPWVKESHSHIKETRLQEFVVTKSFLNSLINKDFANTKNYNHPYIIEKVLLDGSIYKEPLNKTAKEIQIYLTKFIEDSEFTLFIKNTIEDIWNKTKIVFTFGGEFIINHSLNQIKTNDVYITLGSFDTGIKLYQANTIHSSVMIPFGFCNVLEDLGQKWNTDSFSTISWINLFLKEKLNPDETLRIKNDINYAFLPFLNSLNTIEIFNSDIPQAKRPIKIFGLHKVWNDLFLYLLNTYVDKKHLNIKNTDIINEHGDRLVDFYIKEDKH